MSGETEKNGALGGFGNAYEPIFRILADEFGDKRANELILKIAEEMGGEQWYFAQPRHMTLGPRNETIQLDFANGEDYRKLGRKHGLTPRHVRRIVDKR